MSASETRLPEGWAWCVLEDVAEVRLGRQRSPKNHIGPNMVPYLRAANVKWSGVDLADVKEMHFSEDEVARYALEPGDILVAEASGSASEVGKPAIWRGEIDTACFQNTLVRVRSDDPLPEYLLLVLREAAMSGKLGRAALGVGIHHLGQERLAGWTLALPPREEQSRVVEIVERLTATIEAGFSAVREARRGLKAMRIALLARAVDENWPTRPLGELLLSLRNGLSVSRPAESPPGIPIFRISAVRAMALDVGDIRYAPSTLSGYEGYLVNDGDLLFVRYSGNADYVGACAMVRNLPEPTLHPDKLIRGVVDKSIAEPAFLEVACSAGLTLAGIRARRKTTAGQVGIAGGQLKTVPVPLPPLDEQRRVVAEVGRQLDAVNRLRDEVDANLRLGDALVRSLLSRAVSGLLAQQRDEDEPASASLLRVQAMRAAAKAAAEAAKKTRAMPVAR